VYPEIPGALAVMLAVAWRPGSEGTGVTLARGVAIAALPWLSTKYAPMAAAAAIVALLRLRWHARPIATLLLPVALSLAGWFGFFFWIWGTASPAAPYGPSQGLMRVGFLARGGLGLLFDQEYGLIAYAPILAVAFVGLAAMLRAGGVRARQALEVLFVGGALL